MQEQVPEIVVFDLGGVLARICHTWEDVVQGAGVPHGLDLAGRTPLSAFPDFDPYQAGQTKLDTYLDRLANFVGCDREHALRVHNGILVEPYPGSEALIAEIESAGVRTGCLSNTNVPHWEDLALNGRFPAIHRLQSKMASHLVGLNKPDPAIFRLYAETFGVAPERIVFFDDHPLNVRAALGERWRAFRIDPSGDTVAQMRAHLAETGVLPNRTMA